MKGLPTDKVPNLNIVMGLAAREAGVTYGQYVLDYRLLVEGNLRCAEKYGIDCYCAISDPSREASAMGATIMDTMDGPPVVQYSPVYEGYDISKMTFPDPADSPRTLDRLRAVEELVKRSAGDYPVIGWVEGVLAETADMRGVNNVMMDLMDETDGMKETMDRIFEYQCLFAKRQIEAGADMIGIGNAVASLIGPSLYEQYALDYDMRLVQYIQQQDALVKLHICGNISSLLPLLTKVQPDILDIDWMVDFGQAVETFRNTKTCVDGNVDPVTVLLQGTPEHVREMVGSCLAVADADTMMAAGCEVPAKTPAENLIAMNEMLWL